MQGQLLEQAPQRMAQRLVNQLRQKGISDERVLDVIAQVPRHQFVDPALQQRAYEDEALPISKSQTISQPFIVALMTQLAATRRSLKSVLEIGTGCGYQTAILSRIFSRVCTVERIRSLSVEAQERLRKLGIRNVEFQHGDGFVGWRDRAPFDAILVTAAAGEVPKLLLEQLAPDGVLVIPVGEESDDQQLRVYRKQLGEFVIDDVIPVRFVPLLRGLSA